MMAATKGGSADRLLDAAEHVFALKGYDGATTREIASRAGDTLGTLSYHFGTKEELLTAVLKRRLEQLITERRNLYADYAARSATGTPSLEEVVSAIALPLLRLAMTEGTGWSNYLTVLCRCMYAGSGAQASVFARLFDPVGKEFLGWLKAASSAEAHVSAAYAYQFIVGATIDSVVQYNTDRLARISEGEASSSHFGQVSDRLVKFLTAGTFAIVGA